MARKTISYRDAGVDITANDEMVDRIRTAVHGTYGPRVLPSHGGFAGLFRLDYDEKLFERNYRRPVLVACTDGVGSKVLVAAQAGRLDTVGIDLVAMSVNDLLTVGAEPLLFLDYVALHKLEPAKVAEIVEGVARGCRMAGCALLGGETAEMPDVYAPTHFDLAGFAVGVAERSRLMDPRRVQPGDVLLGLASDGIHSNGYALARRLFFEVARHKLDDHVEALGETLVEALLRPTRIYVRPVLAALRHYRRKRVVTSMAHITGGGLEGNVPRMLPANCDAVVRRGSWTIPPVFEYMQSLGVEEEEMYRVFNMGIGYVLAVRRAFAKSITRRLEKLGERVFSIGVVRRGSGQFRWA
ncbi:MAG: phosphoribosylformylglycinamidine cyclo-ligase [Phycisphaerae bacterium]|nr:phosphoribosylformylglycinamidine cyclo-ligase [Phycisphaerae bacterium]NUQ47631.1 phosphoribosylformylglycinamidine cyclo-ligase [Phycisphaerae bacterium]